MRLAAPCLADRVSAFVLTTLVIAAGCAAPAPLPRATDFPLHATEGRFDLHWRVERETDIVRVVGLVEAAWVVRVREVIVELRGLSRDGRIISRGYGRASSGFQQGGPLPFVVELRPRGQEDRFEVGVWSFTTQGERGGR